MDKYIICQANLFYINQIEILMLFSFEIATKELQKRER